MNWRLPESLEVGEKEYSINTDYRDILDIIGHLNDVDEDRQVSFYVSLALFYNGFEQMPESDYQEAIEKMFDFIACGEKDDGRPSPKLIDWEQDQGMIIADINKAAGQEVRALKYAHWWTFVSWFSSIGEGQLSTIVSIRSKKAKHKPLEKWEQEYYWENKKKVDFQPKYTAEEKAEMARLNALLGGGG